MQTFTLVYLIAGAALFAMITHQVNNFPFSITQQNTRQQRLCTYKRTTVSCTRTTVQCNCCDVPYKDCTKTPLLATFDRKVNRDEIDKLNRPLKHKQYLIINWLVATMRERKQITENIAGVWPLTYIIAVNNILPFRARNDNEWVFFIPENNKKFIALFTV